MAMPSQAAEILAPRPIHPWGWVKAKIRCEWFPCRTVVSGTLHHPALRQFPLEPILLLPRVIEDRPLPFRGPELPRF